MSSVSLTPPVGGWDTRNALADMPPENAVIMDNWFPSTDKITLRKGYTSHATGMSGNVESLLRYTALTGVDSLFAANGTSIFDVTGAGAVGAAAVTGMTNARWQQVQIGTAGGQFLVAFNGADTPRTYDGTTWGTFAATGPTVANLIWGNLHQRRLWFGEEDSLSGWYLAVNAITGLAVQFSLAGIARLGGFIMAMGTWTRDAGDGSDDIAVFLTSEGEAILYAGIDPAAAATWALIGVFRIGKPIGRRCMIKAGSDLVMVTEDGFVSAASILTLDRSQAELGAISAQINKAVNDAVIIGRSLFGWEPFLYPGGTMLMFNAPTTATTACQFVFNTITGAPCRFTNVNALTWALIEDDPYFGGTDGVVYRFDNGSSDGGANIEGDLLPAFSYFKQPGQKKAFKMIESIFEANGNPRATIDLNLDFLTKAVKTVVQTEAPAASLWGTALWGTGKWGSTTQTYRGWKGVRGIGRSAAARVRVSTTNTQVSLVATNLIYNLGGVV